jgi:hypothetical protein
MKHSHSRHSQHSHHSSHGGSPLEHPSTPKAKPSPHEIAGKAYEIYLKEGRPQGRDLQHWLQAESEVQG